MTSIKAAAAVAVVAVLIVAAAGYYFLNQGGDDGGNDGDTPAVNAIKSDVGVGDYYTISSTLGTASSYLGSDPTVQTTYTVSTVGDEQIVVDISYSDETPDQRKTMSPEDFLDDISVQDASYLGTYRGTAAVSTGSGIVECNIYEMEVPIANGSITIRDYVGLNSNIIYQTEVVTVYGNSITTDTYTLFATNMIEQGEAGGSVTVPEAPSAGSDIRTDLRAGDYVQFIKYDDDGDVEYEELTIVSVNGSIVYYTEDDDDDLERTTVEAFLSIVRYNGGGEQLRSESIDTPSGTVACDVYEVQWSNDNIHQVFDLDWEDRVVIWASVENGVIYKIESMDDYYDDDDDWDRWDQDTESYYLTGTSLFDTSSGGSSTVDPSPSTPAENRYGIELEVGSYYTITEDDGDTETYTVIAIDGNRLTIQETDERGRTEIERTSANDFLGEILITAEQLDRRYTAVEGDIYQERGDDDGIRVQQAGSNYIVVEHLEYERGGWVVEERITDLNIPGLTL